MFNYSDMSYNFLFIIIIYLYMPIWANGLVMTHWLIKTAQPAETLTQMDLHLGWAE